MSQETRREFLRTTALGLVATAATGTKVWGANGKELASEPSRRDEFRDIVPWVTSDQKRHSRADAVRWQAASGSAASSEILLSPDKEFQEILGFGAAFTEAACFTFGQLAAQPREQLMNELFHPSEMGLNVCRTCIGASDYSLKPYSYDEGEPDPELKRFSIDNDREYIIPALRAARKANPDLFLFSSPWSPPGWMKSGGSMLGGSMRKRYMPAYAQYFLKFLQAYESAGVPVQAVTVQNEVDTDQDARMPACIWPQEFEMEFVREHLGPLLERSGAKTKIWILDHNYNLWGRAIAELDDPEVRKYSNAVAWHAYVGKPEMIEKVHEADPTAEMHWTEGGPDISNSDYANDWAKWGITFTGALRHWCQSLTGWNLALDEQGRPNIGPFPCGGLVTIHSQTKEITRSGQYLALAHFARSVRRGARRFQSESAVSALDHVAFENPDGTRALLVTNSGPAQTTTIRMGKMTAAVSLEKNSVTTLAW